MKTPLDPFNKLDPFHKLNVDFLYMFGSDDSKTTRKEHKKAIGDMKKAVNENPNIKIQASPRTK